MQKPTVLNGAIVLFLLLCVGMSACQTPAGRTAGEVVDDATITTKVKAKLFDDSLVKGLAISVETFEGEVTLTGAVDTEAERQRAEYLATTVTGVKRVNNLLKMKK
jgi:hyperosmotically inducible protein